MSDETKTPTASEIYDRQIRLWGADAQAKMMKAKVLYIHITGVTSEIMKNCVLAGIAATVCDSRPMSALSETPSFFVAPGAVVAEEGEPSTKKPKFATVAEAVQPAVEGLNLLMGECPIIAKSVQDLTQDDVKDFTVVIASRLGVEDAVRIAGYVTKQAGHHFILTDSFGLNGAAILDYGPNCMYRPEQGKKLLDPKQLEPYLPMSDILKVPLSKATNRFFKKAPPPIYVQYRCMLEYVQQKQDDRWLDAIKDPEPTTVDDWHAVATDFAGTQHAEALGITKESCEEWARVYMAELSPVCAVLGGILGNEVIKLISGKGEPANNTVLVDGSALKVWTYLVKEKV